MTHMTADDFYRRCRLLGLATVGATARSLGVSLRQVNRYRAGEFIPRHVYRVMELLEVNAALRRENARLAALQPKER